MNNFIVDIFTKIASKLGLQLTQKTVTENDFYQTNDISLTAIMSDRLATMTLADSSISVDGTSTRATKIAAIANTIFTNRSKEILVTCSGTGDCLIVPITNGKRYAVDIIENKDFNITNALGDYIYGVVMKRDHFVKNNKTYERFEYQSLEEIDGVSVCFIRQYGYVDGKEVELSTVESWQGIVPEQYVPNVDRLLLGRIKCPTVNRENINSVQGVPITYGLDSAVLKAKESYERFNDEYKRKQTKIFADKSLFKKYTDKDEYYVPDGGTFQLMRSNPDGQIPIQEFSPTIQHEALKVGVEFNFKLLEMFAGFSTGVLTDVDVSLETATAIRASLQNTFAYITKLRALYSVAFDDVLYAISMLMNANGDESRGTFTVNYDWSDRLMESTMEMFNMMLQSKGIGAVDTAEIRSWVMNEKLSQSQEWVANNPQETIQEDLSAVI